MCVCGGGGGGGGGGACVRACVRVCVRECVCARVREEYNIMPIKLIIFEVLTYTLSLIL